MYVVYWVTWRGVGSAYFAPNLTYAEAINGDTECVWLIPNTEDSHGNAA